MSFPSSQSKIQVNKEPAIKASASVENNVVIFNNLGELIDSGISLSSIGIIETDYDSLEILKAASELNPGTIYKFTFNTKHVIDNTTNVIHTGDDEILFIQALSEDTFHQNVKSLSFLSDIIFYDFENNTCEDGSTPRPGNISRRISGLTNIPFDFRNVYSRRYNLTADPAAWITATAYTVGQLVLNSGSIYGCFKAHTSGGTFNIDYTTNGYWIILIAGFTSNRYQFSANSALFGMFNLSINTSDFQDSLAISGSNVRFSGKGVSSLNYGDLRIAGTNIEIQEGCEEITTLNGAQDIKTLPYSKKIRIGTSAKKANISGVDINIGSASFDNEIYQGNNITIGNNSNSNKFKTCANGTLGTNSIGNIIGSDLGITDVKISNGCCNNTVKVPNTIIYGKSCYNRLYISFTTVGAIIIGYNSHYNISKDSQNISIGSASSFNRIIKSDNQIIPDSSSNNKYYNSLIVYAAGKTVTSCTYTNIRNKTFSDNTNNVTMLISDSATVTYAATYNNIVIDKQSPDGSLWYSSISNLGTITTNKLI